VFGEIRQCLNVGDALGRRELFGQMNQAWFVHGTERETDASLTIFEGERRATIPAKPATSLVRTLKVTGLTTGPGHGRQGRSDIRPEQSARCLLTHSTMADGGVFQIGVNPEPHRATLTSSSAGHHRYRIPYRSTIRNGDDAEYSGRSGKRNGSI
jgi:hypothetical protein